MTWWRPAASHWVNQWWLIYWQINASFDLNEQSNVFCEHFNNRFWYKNRNMCKQTFHELSGHVGHVISRECVDPLNTQIYSQLFKNTVWSYNTGMYKIKYSGILSLQHAFAHFISCIDAFMLLFTRGFSKITENDILPPTIYSYQMQKKIIGKQEMLICANKTVRTQYITLCKDNGHSLWRHQMETLSA